MASVTVQRVWRNTEKRGTDFHPDAEVSIPSHGFVLVRTSEGHEYLYPADVIDYIVTV